MRVMFTTTNRRATSANRTPFTAQRSRSYNGKRNSEVHPIIRYLQMRSGAGGMSPLHKTKFWLRRTSKEDIMVELVKFISVEPVATAATKAKRNKLLSPRPERRGNERRSRKNSRHVYQTTPTELRIPISSPISSEPDTRNRFFTEKILSPTFLQKINN